MACEVSVMPKRDAEKDLQAAKTTSFLTIREMFNLVRQGIPFWINEAKNWRDIAKSYVQTANEYRRKLCEYQEEIAKLKNDLQFMASKEDIAKLKADLQCMAGKYGREKQMREAAEARAKKAEKVQERLMKWIGKLKS